VNHPPVCGLASTGIELGKSVITWDTDRHSFCRGISKRIPALNRDCIDPTSFVRRPLCTKVHGNHPVWTRVSVTKPLNWFVTSNRNNAACNPRGPFGDYLFDEDLFTRVRSTGASGEEINSTRTRATPAPTIPRTLAAAREISMIRPLP